MSNPIEKLKDLSLVNNISNNNDFNEKLFLESSMDDFEIVSIKDEYKNKFIDLCKSYLKLYNVSDKDFNNYNKYDLILFAIYKKYDLNKDFIGLVKTFDNELSILDMLYFNKIDIKDVYYDIFEPRLIDNYHTPIKSNNIIIRLGYDTYTEISNDFKHYITFKLNSDNTKDILINTKGSNYINGEFEEYIKDTEKNTILLKQAVIASDLILHYKNNEDMFKLFLDNIIVFNRLNLLNLDGGLFTNIISEIKLVYLGLFNNYSKDCLKFIKDNYDSKYSTFSYKSDDLGSYLNFIKFNKYSVFYYDTSARCNYYENIIYDYIKSAYRVLLINLYPKFYFKYMYEEAKMVISCVYNTRYI